MNQKTRSKEDPLKVKTLDFGIRIIRLQRYLMIEKREYLISKQVLRSGTNPGAMVREAAFAESGPDFIHKLSVGLKEISETQYWLELLHATNFITEKAFQSLNNDANEIGRLLSSSITTKKRNLGLL